MASCIVLVLSMFLNSTPAVEFYEKFEPQPAGPVVIVVNPTCKSTHVLIDGYYCPVGKTQIGEHAVRLATNSDYLRYCYVIERLPFGVISDNKFHSIRFPPKNKGKK